MSILSVTSFLLFDDDCGICTVFARGFRTLLAGKTTVIPMHPPTVEEIGTSHIGEDYWKSFHIVKDKTWTTEGDAIVALASLLPMGTLWERIAKIPLIHGLLVYFLRQMQFQRKMECKIDS